MKIDKNKNKKALWIDEGLHKVIKIFAIEEGITIEAATQLLIKLGICEYRNANQAND
tara:strand:+ start:248 stop:418 length:171 start_codon:yes stop_codon:yes gene_type:complete